MSLWTAIKSVFSSSAKPVDDLLDKDNGLLVRAGSWIDGLSYTDQESAEDTKALLKLSTEARKQVIDTVVAHVKNSASENTQRSLTRRYAALAIIRVELFLVLSAIVIWPWNQAYAQFIWLIASSTLMFGAFSAVILFFFGSYGISQHIVKPLQQAKATRSQAQQ